MSPAKQMILFGWSYAAVIILAIAVPYLRRKSDLLTAWNFLLLGMGTFVGLSAVAVGLDTDHFRFIPLLPRDYTLYMAGGLVFTASAFFFYHWLKLPDRIASRFLHKWPTQTTSSLLFAVSLSVLLGLGLLVPPNTPILGELAVQLGNKGGIFAFAFAFMAWWKQKKNPVLIAAVIVTLIYALLLAIIGGSGRRNMVAVVAVVPITLYWVWLRYKSRVLTLACCGLGVFIGFTVVNAYANLRHGDLLRSQGGRNLSNAAKTIKMIPEVMFKYSDRQLIYLGQNSAPVALMAINAYRNEFETEPFHTLKMTLLTPIPRRLWPDKPVGLGYSLPKDLRVTDNVSWGPNIIGHGFHEGGLHMLAFYGFLAAFCVKFFDAALAAQPDNPYLLGFFAASSGHLIGWARGDIFTFNNQIIFCLIAAMLLGWVGRILFGKQKLYGHLPVTSKSRIALNQ